MSIPTLRTTGSRLVAAAIGAIAAAMIGAAGPAASAPQVIALTQVPCQFVESENGTDHNYKSTKKADCEAINARTSGDRLAKAKVITLNPGDYVFRVENKSVPYDLGFWLREKSYNALNPLHRLTKISVSGGGLKPGTTKDYKVTLEPGEYLYSCPLNTTPDYRLVVTD